MERWWTLNGISSGFNVDDINYFLERVRSRDVGKFDAQPHIQESTELKQKILQRLDPQNAHNSEVERWLHPEKGRNLGWIASRRTLEQMWEQVKDRPLIELPLSARIKQERETPQTRTPS